MTLSRRLFLTRSSAFTLGAALPLPAIAELSLGTASLSTVSDGHLVLPGDFLAEAANVPAEDLQALMERHNLSAERREPPCNLALYRDGTNTVLFDVGSGPDFMPSAGKVVESLDALGLAPEDVTHVVFTHAHPDHIWGLIDEFDEPLFYEASYMMGRDEWDYWWNPETVETIGEERAAFAVGAKRRMERIEDSVELFGDGEEILPGIAAVASYGHTPGHMAFEVGTGGNTAMIVGDALVNPHAAFEHPGWKSGSDHDPDLAIETRMRLLDRLASAQMPLVGYHLPGGGIGRAEAADSAYRFVEGEL